MNLTTMPPIFQFVNRALPALLLCLLPVWSMGQTFTLEQYGGRANDSTYDNGPALVKMLDALKRANQSGQAVKVNLGSGDYHIWDTHLPTHEIFISNHDHADQRAVAFWLDGLKDVTIQGVNTKLLFHGRLIPFVLSNCEDVTVCGVSVDYLRPALTQITIKEVSDDVVRAEVLEESKWRVDKDRLVLECEGFDVVPNSCMPFSADGHMKWNRADVSFNPSKVARADDGSLLLYEWSEREYLKPQEVYVLRSYARPTPGVVISDSKRVTLRDVSIHYAEGMGCLAQNSDDLALDHFSVKLPDGSPRRFTTQADATHFSGCRGYIRSTDGIYENMADDAINVHGTYLRVDSILDARHLRASFAHGQTFGIGWYRENDEVALIDRNTLKPLFTSKVADYREVSKKEAIVVLERPLPENIIAGLVPLAIENLSAYPTVDFGYNVVRNNRARGSLFSTRQKVLCHHNLFDHTHGSAILLCGDANGWYESGPCEHVVISDNHFVNALTAMYQFTHAVISIDPEIRQKENGFSYHKRVVIKDNTFTTFPSPLYYAESVEELIIKNNRVISTNDYLPIFENTDSRIIH